MIIYTIKVGLKKEKKRGDIDNFFLFLFLKIGGEGNKLTDNILLFILTAY